MAGEYTIEDRHVLGDGRAVCARGRMPGPFAPASSPARSTPARPYAGLKARQIRALAPERIADLLVGRGAGYALAAELNHYPGRAHMLELADRLALTAEQERAVRAVQAAMQEEAKGLGRRLVDLEAELDRVFRSGRMTPEQLAKLTAAIAEVEGRLRNTHLQAHL